MLDLASKHLLSRYLELHSSTMIDALRADLQQRPHDGGAGIGEPTQARPYCAVWAEVLARSKEEVAALQGRVL